MESFNELCASFVKKSPVFTTTDITLPPVVVNRLKDYHKGFSKMGRYKVHFDRILVPKFTKDLTGMWRAVRAPKATYGTCS